MIRKTINVALTLGAVVTGGLSIASMFTPVIWDSRSPSRWSCVCINKSRLTITQFLANDPVLLHDLAESRKWTLRYNRPSEFHMMWRRKTYVGSGGYLVKYFDQTLISVPLLLPFLAFTLYPTIAFIRGPLRRWRRPRKGLCQKCGYNLTGNVTGTCSECGSPISNAE